MVQIKISRRVINKIFLGMIWALIPLLFLASVLLFFAIWDSKIDSLTRAISLVAIPLILIFANILIILSTKYKKEMLLNDTERKKKWRLLRKDFRDFHKKMIIFEAIFFIYMIIIGLLNLFNHNSDKFSGIFLIILGFLLLIGTIKSVMELRKMEKFGEK